MNSGVCHSNRRPSNGCSNQDFRSSVPQGRLNLAQDASPGSIMRHGRVPQGRLKFVQDCLAAYFQPSLRDWSSQHPLKPGFLLSRYGPTQPMETALRRLAAEGSAVTFPIGK
jgi:hypothetical protein